MKKAIGSLLIFIQCFSVCAQKTEEGFDFSFKPTKNVPRYFVVTEKKDSLWHRQAWYLPERTMYLDGWYKDEHAEIPHGLFSWFHDNKTLKATGRYVNGKKEGTWLEFNETGQLTDTAFFVAGIQRGIRLRWYDDGMPMDSINNDASGSGVQVRWHPNGQVSMAGAWVQDTLRHGRWNHFHPNGKVSLTRDYSYGKELKKQCYDAAGIAMDSSLCVEKEAEFPGGSGAWMRYIQKNLDTKVPIKKGAPNGQFQVVVQFIVDVNGQITGIKPRTKFGFGMEEELTRLLQKSPRWQPAFLWGTNVKAYRLQPVTFVISDK